jgi:hypothetical protein
MENPMKKLLLLAVLLVPTLAQAQTAWNYVGPLNSVELQAVLDRYLAKSAGDTLRLQGHGIAVDPDGKVWFQPFSNSDSVLVNEVLSTTTGPSTQPVRVIYVINPDGSQASISPIKFVDLPGGQRDTLGGFVTLDANGNKIWDVKSGRGLRRDHQGNILVSQFDALYRLDYKTGAGLNKTFPTPAASLTQADADANGNIVVANVFPGNPLKLYSADFTFQGNVTDATSNFSRSVTISPDGNTVFETDYENTFVIVHQRPDEFSPFDSVGVILKGMRVESAAVNPGTGRVWFSAGNPLNQPNQNTEVVTTWLSNTWYSFEMDDLLNFDGVETPVEFFTWPDCAVFDQGTPFVCDDFKTDDGGRPRGITFSTDGSMAYVTQFNETAPVIEVFSMGPVAIERDLSTIPETFTLSQNYPNPFNPVSKIAFSITERGPVRLKVYDTAGREVASLVNQTLIPGQYTVTFDGAELASGTYYYTLEFGGQRLTKAMTLVK